MPKNKGKGGKGKRKGKRNKGKDQEKREIRFKEFGEEYGQVRKILGNCRVEAYCFDGKVRLAHVRGKFKKRIWINKDDFVLVGLREYQDDKGDVIHKYTPDEARLLRSWGEIPADKALFDDDLEHSGDEKEYEHPPAGSDESEDDDDEEDDEDDEDEDDEDESDDEDIEDGEDESSSEEEPVKSVKERNKRNQSAQQTISRCSQGRQARACQTCTATKGQRSCSSQRKTDNHY